MFIVDSSGSYDYYFYFVVFAFFCSFRFNFSVSRSVCMRYVCDVVCILFIHSFVRKHARTHAHLLHSVPFIIPSLLSGSHSVGHICELWPEVNHVYMPLIDINIYACIAFHHMMSIVHIDQFRFTKKPNESGKHSLNNNSLIGYPVLLLPQRLLHLNG